MKMKKASVKGMPCMEYLEHFKQDKYMQRGHNDSGKVSIDELQKEALETTGKWAEYQQLPNPEGNRMKSAINRIRSEVSADEAKKESRQRMEKRSKGRERY